MTRRFTSEKQIRSCAWLLHAEFDVAGHPLLADIQTDKLFPEYVRECFDVPASYLNQPAPAGRLAGGRASDSDDEGLPPV